jgi:adenylyltransferase/sulfurtransferase
MDVKRFSRQIIIEELGIEGQILLNESKVLIIGLGGLGCPVAMYLTLAGVGTIGLMDFDKVDLSNLQRQPLFYEEDVGKYKVEAAEKNLKKYNKNIKINIYQNYFDLNHKAILKEFDLIIDCTDNIPTRKIINQATLEMGKPFLYCSIDQFTVQIALLNYNNGPCYECLYPNLENSPWMNCMERGILGPVSGIAGLYQALEAIKFLANMKFLKNQILYIDLYNYKQLKLNIEKNKQCMCNHYHFKHYDKKKTKIEVFSISKEDLIHWKDYIIVDIRQDNDFEIYKKLGFENKTIYKIDLKELAYKSEDLPKNKKTVVLCSSGARARQAALLLKQLSFLDVYYLKIDEFLI